MKEVLAYRINRLLGLEYVPLTIPLHYHSAVFYGETPAGQDAGRCLGSGYISGTAQAAILNCARVPCVFGCGWIEHIPPDLFLLEVLARGADPNADNHPVSAAIPLTNLPRLADYLDELESFPVQKGQMFRIDWEMAFDEDKYRSDSLSCSMFTNSRLRQQLRTPEGERFMERLLRLPPDWPEQLLSGLRASQKQCAVWSDAIAGGIRELKTNYSPGGIVSFSE